MRSAPTFFFFTPFLLAFRRTLEGAFVVSRSDLPFFVGARGKLGVALACGRPTLGATSPMKPRGSFSSACSYVILPAFSLRVRGRWRSVRRAEGNGGASSGNARKSFAMLPDARLEKGTKRWDDEGFCFENRRSAGESPPSVLLEFTGAMNVFRCDGSTWRGIVNFMVRFVGKGACAAAKIGGESR